MLARAAVYLVPVILSKTRLCLQQRFQFGAYASLVQYPEPLLHDFAVSANQDVLRLRGNAQFTPNAVLPVVIQIKKHKLDSIAKGLLQPVHDGHITPTSRSPIGKGIVKREADDLLYRRRFFFHYCRRVAR